MKKVIFIMRAIAFLIHARGFFIIHDDPFATILYFGVAMFIFYLSEKLEK